MSQIHFKNFEPEFQLRFHANVVLTRLLDTAPYGANGVGLIEKKGDNEFHCRVDIYSLQGPFMASSVGESPELAIHLMEEKIQKQIQEWQSRRQGGLQHGISQTSQMNYAAS